MGRFLNADAFAATGQGLLGNNMFAYCNNCPVFYTDDAGSYPVVVVEEANTEETSSTETEKTYSTTIYYYIVDTESYAKQTKAEVLSITFTFNVTNSGIIEFDNKSNAALATLVPAFSVVLAVEMERTAKSQVTGALRGRTKAGLAFELVAHSIGSLFGIKPDNTNLTEMGSNVQGSTGYDYNADWFEHPIRNIKTILHILLN